jgi:hypothetical protein
MDAALYALVDVLACMEMDMRTGHSSFAKVNERHAALRAIAEAAADATNVPLRPALPGRHPVSTERSNQPSTAAPAAPAVSAAQILSDLMRSCPQVTHATPAPAE